MKSNFSLIKGGFLSFMHNVCNTIAGIKGTKAFVFNKYNILFKELRVFFSKAKNLLNTNIELGLYHFYRGNVSEAKFRFLLINIFFPKLPMLKYNIGRCNFALGNINKAYNNFLDALKLDSSCEEALYYIKKIKDPNTITYVPNNLIQQYFDYTGEYFVEHWLSAKQYKGYELVYIVITKIMGDRQLQQLNILDLGCGTGICGQFLKACGIGNYIVGVDISNRMLNIARGCFVNGAAAYNELINMEISKFLKRHQNLKYDIIILAEVLNYMGDLTLILELTSKLLNENGIIICLVRRKNGEGFSFVSEGDFFRYSEEYIRSIVLSINMKISYMSYCKIYGSQVDGILFTVQLKK